MGWLEYSLFALIFILLVWFYLGLLIALAIVTPRIKTLNETVLEESLRDPSLIPYLNDHLTSDYTLVSKYGYSIHVYELIKDSQLKKFVVLSHGHTYSHHGVIKYAKMMHRLGFNVIMYDQRFHGLSGGKNTTLGYYEQYDLFEVISHIYKIYGDDIYLGTYGESMGSSTVLLEQKIDDRVKFVISDAGFKDLKTLIKRQIKQKHLPSWLFYDLVNVCVWLISKANLSKVSPIEAIKESKIPIMFVHGKQDNFIPYSHTVEMFETYQGEKMLYLADKQAFHARSYYQNKDEYFEALEDFSQRFLK